MLALFAALLPVLVLRLRSYTPPPVEEPVPEPAEAWKKDDQRMGWLRDASLRGAAEPASPDWPQWRGPRRDGVSDEKISAAFWPPRTVWKVRGGAGHSSISIAAGRAVTLIQEGDNEVVLCLDASTGAEVWRHVDAAKFFEPYAGVGPHSTPTMHGGRVYAVGATGLFHCLDGATGKVLWEHDLPKKFECAAPDYGLSCSPLIEGDLVVVIPGSATKGSVAAFHRETGALVWTALAEPSGYSSPVAATIGGKRQIVAVTGKSVSGLAPPDGTVLWTHPWTTRRECNIATPIVAGDYVFVSSGYGKGCALLEIGSEARPVYEHNRMRNLFSTCVVNGEHLYGLDDAMLVCMELRTGKVLWKQRGFDKGSVLLAGGTLIVLGENGRLALVEPRPSAYNELAATTISTTKCWAVPSLARRKLYVRDQEFIYCLDLGAER
jgi:outer membrane protein assembly factor BamB